MGLALPAPVKGSFMRTHWQRELKERCLVKSRVWSFRMKECNGGGQMQVTEADARAGDRTGRLTGDTAAH